MAAEIIHPQSRQFVSKPWGWEDWIVNDLVVNLCQKVLFIKAGQCGNIHRHRVKDEVMTCDSGCLTVEHLRGNPAVLLQAGTSALVAVQTVRIVPGMAVRLRPGEWHRLSAGVDTYVYEASTFHSDDDVERADAWIDILGPEGEEDART